MTVQVLDDGRSDGVQLGNTSNPLNPPKVGFFGKTPSLQPAGNAQVSLTRGANAGLIMGFSATNSPASVATLTTVTSAMTLVGATGNSVSIASGDVLFVNKPTNQAGLGIGNLFVSSTNVACVTWSNPTAGFLTPTASQVYSFMAIRGLTSTTATLTPAAVAASTTAEQTFAVTGLRVGELIQTSKPTTQSGLDIVGTRVVSNNVLGITFANATSGTLTPTAAQSYTVIGLGGLDAQNNDIIFQVTAATLAAVGASTITTAGTTLTNIALTDVVLGVQKATQQAGLGAFGGLVSTAGQVSISFTNASTASITPTANEVYTVRVWRPNVAAPLVIYQPTLTPVSIAANTSAEQGFTVTGLITSSMVWVNKPSCNPGIGITGCRVSAFNTLAINFTNFTSATLTPTAAEVYTVGNFQMPVEATGNSFLQTALLIEQQTAQLGNAMQATLSGLGLMAGA